LREKRSGKPIAAKARPKGVNVVDLMDALKRSIANDRGAEPAKGKKPRKPQRDKRKCFCQSAVCALPRLKQRMTSLRHRDVELWQLDRKIGTFKMTH